MDPLSIAIYTSTGFYFSAFLYFASALLLAALYKFRWKSDAISFPIWLIASFGVGLTTWLITHDISGVILASIVYIFLVLGISPLAITISLFGVFFLASMLLPTFYLLMWLFELMSSLHLTGLSYLALLLGVVLIGVLAIMNIAMGSWIILVRYSPLYFRFPRLQQTWKEVKQAPQTQPFVSIHVPCFNEPPDIVIQTLNALAKLQYPHFEVIVLDNNTKDPNIWKPIEEHCLKLGKPFYFYHIDSLPGAKAGALNACLKLTSPQAEIIGVLDSDYISQPNFLAKLVGFFEDPKVGFVQACQDYRNWEKVPYLSGCYYEYETHFKLELTGQNEWNVNYTIGTMCLIRRKAIEEAGGWAEWCLTEDSEIAVRIHALGYEGHYLNESMGYGLIPDLFENYKQQRFRWTAGPVQQFQKHWRLYIPWSLKSRLSLIQKFGEISHSMSVFFNEALNLLLNLPILVVCLWFAITQGHSFVLPLAILFFIPIALIRNMICNWISIRVLGGTWKSYLLASIALRSLIFTRNMAFFKAWFSKKLAWKRTDKFKASKNFSRIFYSSSTEIIAALVYTLFAVILGYFANFRHPDVIFIIWLGIVNRAISYLCAPVMALLSEHGLQESE